MNAYLGLAVAIGSLCGALVVAAIRQDKKFAPLQKPVRDLPVFRESTGGDEETRVGGWWV